MKNIKTIYFLMYWENGLLLTAQTDQKFVYEAYLECTELDQPADLTVVGRNNRILLHPNTPPSHKAKPKYLLDKYIVDRGIMDIPIVEKKDVQFHIISIRIHLRNNDHHINR